MSNILNNFLEEEKNLFLANSPTIKMVKDKKKKFYFVFGDEGYLNSIEKLFISSFILFLFVIPLVSYIFVIYKNVIPDFDKMMISVFAIGLIPIYMLLSFTTEKGIYNGINRMFLSSFVKKDKIKKISKFLPNEIIEKQKKIIDQYGNLNLRYKDIKEAVEILKKQKIKNELFGKGKV